MKHIEQFRQHFTKVPTFTMRDAKLLLGNVVPSGYLRLLIHNLRKTGEVKRITRGTYTFHDEAQLVGFAFEPFYYGLQDALSLLNLWEQETNPIVITPRKIRSGTRNFEGNNYLVRHLDRKMFFGFEFIKYFNYWLPVSNPEKTLIDFAYFKEPLSQETLKEIKKRINHKKLNEYLKRTPQKTRERVLKLLKKQLNQLGF